MKILPQSRTRADIELCDGTVIEAIDHVNSLHDNLLLRIEGGIKIEVMDESKLTWHPIHIDAGYICISKSQAKGVQKQYWLEDWTGKRRLPNGTGVCQISHGYYNAMVKNNQAIGINISNWQFDYHNK